jgi:hypothetical protein
VADSKILLEDTAGTGWDAAKDPKAQKKIKNKKEYVLIYQSPDLLES